MYNPNNNVCRAYAPGRTSDESALSTDSLTNNPRRNKTALTAEDTWRNDHLTDCGPPCCWGTWVWTNNPCTFQVPTGLSVQQDRGADGTERDGPPAAAGRHLQPGQLLPGSHPGAADPGPRGPGQLRPPRYVTTFLLTCGPERNVSCLTTTVALHSPADASTTISSPQLCWTSRRERRCTSLCTVTHSR